MSLEELRSQLGTGANELIEAMVNRGLLRQAGGRVSLPDFVVRLSQAEAEQVSRLLEQFVAEPYRPPAWGVSLETVGEEVLASLLENGELVRVSESVLLSREGYSRMTDWVRERLEETGRVTVGEVRDQFATSRKYALAVLEQLDQIGVTVRDGDFHRLSATAGN
jgi:selenocysteine-specific elongation factor